MLDHKTGIREIIKKKVAQGVDYSEILKNIYGADPREVWGIYKKYKKTAVKKLGLINLYHQYPEPHPAYSQWRITPAATKIILSKIAEKNYKAVCFLGCPIIGLEFAKLKRGRINILDIDQGVLNYATKSVATAIYDANKPVPKKLQKQFDCVVCDPPWYHEDLVLFIKRAAELAKLGGTIYSSLPSLLTKPSIPKERLELQKILSNSGLIIAELYPLVEYEVPPFEYMAYQDIPPFSGAIWRRGDWLKLKKCKNSSPVAPTVKVLPSWIEYSLDKKRIFIKDRPTPDKYEKPKLHSLIKDDILNSVSRRNPLIPQIDIWTSRNAILRIKQGTAVIKTIMENIKKNEADLIKIISNRYKIDKNQALLDCVDTIKTLKRIVRI